MKNSKNKGNWFEEKVRKCINSGSLWFAKGDLATSDFLIDCKYTEKKSFSITQKILEKIWEEALTSHKMPKLIIGIPRNDNKMFILDCTVYIENKGE